MHFLGRFFHVLTAIFFETGITISKTGTMVLMATLTKSRNPAILHLGVRLVPNGHTLTGFALGTNIATALVPSCMNKKK